MSNSSAREAFDGIYDMPVNPTLADLFRVFERNLRLRLRTAAPAKVIKYDATTQKADVELQHLPVVKIPGTPNNGETPMPPVVITAVPVAFPRGTAGTSYMTWPIQPGDTGQIISCDRSLEAWLQTGVATDPYASHTHNFADSVFYPGLHSDTDPITPPTDAAALVVEGPTINLGSTATEFLLKGTSIKAAADAAFATLNAVPGATDPATTQTLANANKAAILALLQAISSNVSTKTKTL